MAVGTILATIAGSTALAGGATAVSNAVSNKKTNAANWKIAQMNNEYNAQMLQKQMDYNTEMYERQLRDTSPSAQRQRYEEAGLNPYLLVDKFSGGSGTVQGISPASAAGATMNPTQFDFSQLSGVVGEAINLYNESQKTKAQTKLQEMQAAGYEIENQYKGAELAAKIADLKASARSKDANAILTQVQTDLQRSLKNLQVRNLDLTNQGLELSNSYRSMENAMKAIELQNFPNMVKLNISNLEQDILTKIKNRELIGEQIKNAVQQGLKMVAETSGIKWTNEYNKKAEYYLLERLRAETKRAWNNTGPDNYFQFGSSLANKATESGLNPFNWFK